ncbi:MAG: alpha/beta hydrolase [Gammaproteobacteria bacterium]
MSSILFILLGTWLGLSLLLYVFQDRFVYYPFKSLAFTPDRIGLEYEEVYLETEDGEQLHAWFIPAENADTTLLFFHGNAGNISHRLDSIRIFHEMGMNVFIFDYRGYGKSSGRPSEEGTYRDARAAWEYLTGNRGIPPDRIVLFGRSLGAAVAAWLARQTAPAALILESAFTSVRAMGKKLYPYLPVGLLTRIRYPTLDYIRDTATPILVIHSREDEIIPFEFGQQLHAAADGRSELLSIKGGHNDGFLVSGDHYRRGIADFIHKHVAP